MFCSIAGVIFPLVRVPQFMQILIVSRGGRYLHETGLKGAEKLMYYCTIVDYSWSV